MFDELSFINTAQKIKILKPFKKSISIPRIDEKKLHTQEFQLKGFSKRWDASCFRVFQTIVTYCHWKRCFFRTYQMHFSNISKVNFKLLIPEILFMLVLWFLLQNYHNNNFGSHLSKDFSKMFNLPQSGGDEDGRVGACHNTASHKIQAIQ